MSYGDGASYRDTDGAHLRRLARPIVGFKRPHADEATTVVGDPVPHSAATSSLRRNEPELTSVLESEPLPSVNVAPDTDWFEPELNTNVPGPLTTDQLIPLRVQQALRTHRLKVQQAYRRANAQGGWRVARDLRPPPLEFSEEESVLPAGRGWAWHRRQDGLWYPLTRSRWPDDPPESELDVAAVLRGVEPDVRRFGASDRGFDDSYVVASMAHGYEAPQLERATVVGYPHVGALKNIEALHKAIAKDRKQDGHATLSAWTEHGGDLPQVWPVRADPVNVVMRYGKGRMTIDKSMRLSASLASYNDEVDLGEYDPVVMVRVEQLCRAVSILGTAGVGVRIWKFDLEAYFRRIGKQRADWWVNGYVLPDGYAFDKRVQFGQREAPVLTSRQSNLIVWMIQREIWAFDRACPARDPHLLAWIWLRSQLAGGDRNDFQCRLTSLGFQMMYVDDAGGASMDDLLFNLDGSPVFGVWNKQWGCYDSCGAEQREAVHLRRPDVHYAIALAVIVAIGHTAADGKGQPPSLAMELLGTHIDVAKQIRRLPELKCKLYGAAVSAALAARPTAQGALHLPFGDFNSMVHKLLHASDTVVLGRQHAHHCMAALRVENRMHGRALLHEPQQRELRWWLEQLQSPERHCLPLASRVVFPMADSASTMAAYSDAARELDSPQTSGYGGWTVFDDTLVFVAGLWEPWELAAFSINVLELAALNISTFTLLAHGNQRGRRVTHVLDFVDNTAAEYAADRGKPKQAAMRELVQARYDALDSLGIFSVVERITSVDNEWADALSRGHARIEDVLRFARAVGLKTARLQPAAAWRNLAALPTTW